MTTVSTGTCFRRISRKPLLGYLGLLLSALPMVSCTRDPTGPGVFVPDGYEIWDSNADWSPDGTLIAYLRSARDPSQTGGVWVISPDGGSPDSVRAYSDMPSWSWDSRYLAVVDVRDGKIHVHDRNNWEELAATSGPGHHLRPQWHPDNRHLFYYIPSGPDSLVGIWVFDMETGASQRSVVESGQYPAVDSSGTRLIFTTLNSTGREVLRLADLDQGTQSALYEFDPYGPGPANAITPRFSPDGLRVLFWSYGKVFHEVRGIWEFSLTDSSMTYISDHARDPSYSVTADTVVYTAELPDDREGAGLLWMLELTSGARWQITNYLPW